MDPRETIIILGDSPFIKEVNHLPYILDRYYTIGINRAIVKNKTHAFIFVDEGMVALTANFNGYVISLKRHGDLLINVKNKELVETFTYNFKAHNSYVESNKLAWCGFTHDLAISYCINKGWKNIILLGTADFTGTVHSSCNKIFNYSESLKLNSKKFIEEICSKYANIYTCNPNSILDIPRITLQELLT